MNCDEVQEYISAAVDGEIDRLVESHVNDHLTKCNKCRNEVELERMTKLVVHRNLQRVNASRTLAADILSQLAHEGSSEEKKPAGWFDTLFGLLTWRTAFAVSGVLAIIVLLVLIPSRAHHSHTQPNDDNMLHQAYNNFDGILDGKIVPTVTSTDPSTVKAYFTSKAKFNVNVPHLRRCSLLGGIFSEYKHEGLAHVVYKHNNKIIYMYQAKLCTVMGSGCLHLPIDARNELQQSGWYFENHEPDCTLAMWVVDSTVCCAIADINKEQLMACLKDTE